MYGASSCSPTLCTHPIHLVASIPRSLSVVASAMQGNAQPQPTGCDPMPLPLPSTGLWPLGTHAVRPHQPCLAVTHHRDAPELHCSSHLLMRGRVMWVTVARPRQRDSARSLVHVDVDVRLVRCLRRGHSPC